jgi:integrase
VGARPISAIDGALITEALAPIWTTKPETARRVKQRIERVIQWVRDGRPLPRKIASKRVKHHAALPFADAAAFMTELRDRDSISARALEFTILTAARTSEVIGARWAEIDLDAGVWTVPAVRMKGDRPLNVMFQKKGKAPPWRGALQGLDFGRALGEGSTEVVVPNAGRQCRFPLSLIVRVL